MYASPKLYTLGNLLWFILFYLSHYFRIVSRTVFHPPPCSWEEKKKEEAKNETILNLERNSLSQGKAFGSKPVLADFTLLTLSHSVAWANALASAGWGQHCHLCGCHPVLLKANGHSPLDLVLEICVFRVELTAFSVMNAAK